ncbi:MAG: tRNA pseudouridine(55) synthase TruB [Clostridia bacterium]|nr:tRNA pseudouridine(55) synthase TruB [Clostridia bacterium]
MQGLILLNKPQGITSFSAVSAIKRAANEKRVGHTGTLDPMATGVLPILLGRATSLSSLMLDADKRYTAEIKLGVTTDSDDITGNVIFEREVKVKKTDIEKAISVFMGVLEQIPPMYSALKKDGVRLYKLAREGKSFEIEPRKIEVFENNLLSFDEKENTFKIDVHVSKGTYIRSLARDIGEYLGCGATLTQLCRTAASGFSISDCVSLEDIQNGDISEFILSEEQAVLHLPEINITDKQATRFCNGGQLGYDRLQSFCFSDGTLLRVKNKGRLLGIGVADDEKKQINIKCIINYPE